MSSVLFTHEPPAIREESLASLMEPRYEPLVALSIDSPKSVFMAKFKNNISGSDVFQCVNLSLEEKNNPAGVNLVLDFRASNLNAMPLRNLVEMAEGLDFWLEQENYQKTRVVIVATGGDNHVEADANGRLFDSHLEAVHICSDTKDAVAWLESESQ